MSTQTNYSKYFVPGLPTVSATQVVIDALKEINKLDKDFKKQWVDALRSGNFYQGNGYLCTEGVQNTSNGYCCLGVGCVVAGYEQRKLVGKQMPSELFYTPEEREEAKLPELLKGEKCGAVTVTPTQVILNFLAQVNDSGEYSFNEIALWIEENL